MSTSGADYTTSFVVDQSPEDVFGAINDVGTWWYMGRVEGDTDRLGGEFTYTYENVHYCKQRITEFVPGKRIVWRVLEGELTFVSDRREWDGTDIVFDIADRGGRTEVRFTHVGLGPDAECYDRCVDAWGHIINTSLRQLIVSRAR